MLNKIEKGMSNAAEKINENFEGVSENLIPEDITSQFSLKNVNRFKVFKVGKLVMVYGSTKPAGDWKDLVTTDLKFVEDASLSYGISSYLDREKNVTVTLTKDGVLKCRGSNFEGNVIFSGITILDETTE